MKIIYVGEAPYACPVFDFERLAAVSTLRDNATLVFLGMNALKLPWQLKTELVKAEQGEKVVVHATSPQGVVAAVEGGKMQPTDNYHIVYTPPYTDDPRDVDRMARYASMAGLVLFADADMERRARQVWSVDCPMWLLPAPVVAPAEGEIPDMPERLLYQGEITRGARLEEAVEYVAAHSDATLRVNGTGKGRYAMPAVKLSRRLGLQERVDWAGSDYDGVIIPADRRITLLVPEPHSPWQQVVMASYAAQGVAIKRSATDATTLTPPEAVAIDDFFATLLKYYRGL